MVLNFDVNSFLFIVSKLRSFIVLILGGTTRYYLLNRLDIPVDFYIHEKLFSPLGITNYVLNMDDIGSIPYFGGVLLQKWENKLIIGNIQRLCLSCFVEIRSNHITICILHTPPLAIKRNIQ